MTDPDRFNPYRSPGADPSPHPTDRPESAPPHKDLLVLSTFDNVTQAHLLRNELAFEGIYAYVTNGTSASSLGDTPGGPSSAFRIEVLVRRSDTARAMEVKQSWLAAEVSEESEIPE